MTAPASDDFQIASGQWHSYELEYSHESHFLKAKVFNSSGETRESWLDLDNCIYFSSALISPIYAPQEISQPENENVPFAGAELSKQLAKGDCELYMRNQILISRHVRQRGWPLDDIISDGSLYPREYLRVLPGGQIGYVYPPRQNILPDWLMRLSNSIVGYKQAHDEMKRSPTEKSLAALVSLWGVYLDSQNWGGSGSKAPEIHEWLKRDRGTVIIDGQLIRLGT